jgi:hypothetical protein
MRQQQPELHRQPVTQLPIIAHTTNLAPEPGHVK